MSDWLEGQLAGELRPVSAPEGLWGQVQAARRPQPRRRFALRMPALVAITALVGVWAVWSARGNAGLEDLAALELGRPGHLELRSSDAVEIGAWLQREAGVEVAIPVSSRVRLEGARVIRRRGATIGEVMYRVGDRSALLLVTRAGTAFRASSKHGGLSWYRQQQVYALACSMPERPQAACGLCHANL
ncbi:MAG: hypothetical protein WDO73_19915 [Ignavibacteriota bacterium]